jgi:hypothetical protein
MICDVCEKEISKNGSIVVDFNELHRYEEEKDEWNRKRENKTILEPQDLLAHPESVKWKCVHDSCVPDSQQYIIEFDRFDTVEKAFHWTLHLMDKTWFHRTDWRAAIDKFFPEISNLGV